MIQRVLLALFPLLSPVLFALPVAGAAQSPQAPVQATLTVMSFNVRTPADTQPGRRWEDRRDAMAAVILQAHPQVIGTQELTQRQAQDLQARLPGYHWFGRGRRGDEGDEHMGVFYDTKALRVIESGDFWLSDTPEVPGSISWGHPYPRMVTWALFERVSDHRRFQLFNTHLPYRQEDEPARVLGARLLLTRIQAVPSTVPVVVTGDFNCEPGSDTWRTLTAVLHDARAQAGHVEGGANTFHDFSGRADRQLDWILLRGLRAERFATLQDRPDGILPSDHFPVLATLHFPP
ncbi:MAG TPA: endonuclease/exonuclease/phosphatase family protein [Stenotrophomonas sp.]|jgi:endonuclease/exonuclease/phosphatase family metal-dependent hydrolase